VCADLTGKTGEKFKINELKVFWNGICNVEVQETITNPENKRQETVWHEKYTEIPCKRVYKQATISKMEGLNLVGNQMISLILEKKYDIPLGAKIIYVENGETTIYRRAGVREVYPSIHQQILLESFTKI